MGFYCRTFQVHGSHGKAPMCRKCQNNPALWDVIQTPLERAMSDLMVRVWDAIERKQQKKRRRT